MRVGVLALQGAVKEHLRAVRRLGHTGVEVRLPEQLEGLDAIILPGGESTAMRRLLDKAGLLLPLQEFVLSKPTLGTCAGAILLAKRIEPSLEAPVLGVLDVTVERNAYGSQLDSFTCRGDVAGLQDFPLVFIRAPRFAGLGPNVSVLASCNGQIVGVRAGHTWALAFHPELTEDLRLHEMFLRPE
ncbi:MAG: Pyridoxal 5'-phosphate synthase subunit PdxT [Firmicutes bacterium]|nr:Pyridoxal 5'-phosphate synthase subunit PdxT [candidate division NPL-UPA2 bacterium]